MRITTNATTCFGQVCPESSLHVDSPMIVVVAEIRELHKWRLLETATSTHNPPIAEVESMATAAGSVMPISAEMVAYAEYEARRRGVGTDVVLAEEMTAKKLFDEEPFTIEELEAFVVASNPDPCLLEGDEECPF